MKYSQINKIKFNYLNPQQRKQDSKLYNSLAFEPFHSYTACYQQSSPIKPKLQKKQISLHELKKTSKPIVLLKSSATFKNQSTTTSKSYTLLQREIEQMRSVFNRQANEYQRLMFQKNRSNLMLENVLQTIYSEYEELKLSNQSCERQLAQLRQIFLNRNYCLNQ